MKFFAFFMQQNTVQSSIGNFDVSKTLAFSTQLNGGFATCSMIVPLPAAQGSMTARAVLGSFCTVYDEQGRYVYNGRVSAASSTGDGVRVNCVGIFEDGAKKTVPTALWLSPTTTNGDVITDCVDLVPSWRGGVNTARPNVPVGTQDYNDEVKVNAQIGEMLKVGYRTDSVKPMYFVIYNDQVPQIVVEQGKVWQDWYVPAGVDGRIGSSVSIQDVYNKIYVLYDDTAEDSVGPTMYPTAANDYGSQWKYGVREGVLNVGEYGLALGIDLQELAIQKYAQPTSGVPISITGFVQSHAGNYVPSYMVRAGDLVGIIDNDESAALHALDETEVGGFVTGTNFSASNMTTKLTLSTSDKRLDYLLARLGLTGGLG